MSAKPKSLGTEDVRLALAEEKTAPYDFRAALGPHARDAAVLVPLSFEGAFPTVHVVVRAASLREHAGEVSFPGGKVESGETLIEALHREIEEEMGIAPSEMDLLGALWPVPVVTGRFLIHPYVAAVRTRPRITSAEHAMLYEVPLARWLVDAEEIELAEAPWRGLPLVVPFFRVGQHVMYGASAVILFDLLSRLSAAPLTTRLVEAKPWGDRYRSYERPPSDG